MLFRTRIAALATAALSVTALAACGSTPAAPTPPQQQNVLTLLANDVTGSLQKVVDRATKAKSVTVKMNGTAAGETTEGEGVFQYGEDLKAELSMRAAGTTIKVRMLGPVIYMSIPEAQRAETEGKSWMKMDLAAAAGQAGTAFTKEFDDMDPVRQVKALLAADTVTVVGEETVNDVKTVHYTVTIPLATYLGELDADLRANAEKELTKAGIKDIKTDLWVDEKYQPRRVHMVMGTLTDMTVDYLDYGKPVTIEAPPASEVFDLAEVLERLKTGG